ncbi:MAG: META domain-containing protein [Methanoregula sp.]|uniref:META domain-containing protein n=1 Tax=Methanoregula sp. TaxID=2052170 RepID=UPI003C27F22D
MDGNGTPGTPPDQFKAFARIAFIAIAVILLLVFLSGLMTQPLVPGSTPNWTLESYRDATGVLIPVINDGDITARFENGGNITGSSGCNQYVAAYLENGKQMRIMYPLHTALTWADPGIMQQEETYYHDLEQAAMVQTGPSEIDILGAQGNTLLVFRRS